MPNWWDGHPEERYWCEITDRRDVGADLKCPQTNEAGGDYWSYRIINEVTPGDVVFHYSTRKKAFVGASVAGAPLEERPIIWSPHGTVGRAKKLSPEPRPGWWLPLYHFTRFEEPLTLAELQEHREQEFIRDWISGHGHGPFQPYPKRLRASQGYLTKMPNVFVERWEQLSKLSSDLAEVGEEFARIAFFQPKASISDILGTHIGFQPKNDKDYEVIVRGGAQIRSRSHETLVGRAAIWLQALGASVSNPHPIDLLVTNPCRLIIEAKAVKGDPLFAVREAVGQLHEYRHFIGPREANLCILLDVAPGPALIHYVESELHLFIFWHENDRFAMGSKTARFVNLQLSPLTSGPTE